MKYKIVNKSNKAILTGLESGWRKFNTRWNIFRAKVGISKPLVGSLREIRILMKYNPKRKSYKINSHTGHHRLVKTYLKRYHNITL